MSDQSKIIAKIKALIAKAEGTDNEHEAATFMAKAQELLAQHQIDASALGSNPDDPVIIKRDGFKQTDSSPSWYKDLYVALGYLYGCRAVKNPCLLQTPTGKTRWGYAIELTGRESAIVTAELMYPWVRKQCMVEGLRLSKITGEPSNKQSRRVGNALVRRIYRLIALEKAKNAEPKTDAARNALVIQDEVDRVFDEAYPNLGKARNVSTSTDYLSHQAAQGIGLHRQAGGETQLQLGSK